MPGVGRDPNRITGGASGAIRLPVGSKASRARYVHLQPGQTALILTPTEWAELDQLLDDALNTRGGRAVGRDTRLGAVAHRLHALRADFAPGD